MKKVLVTGASGFVGGHLVDHLNSKGYQVSPILRQNIGDHFSVNSWRRVIEKAEAESIVHLIAKTHSSDADKPSALDSYRRINVDITRALLEASKASGVKQFVYLSSIKTVGEETPIDVPFTEDSPCNPQDCYGISKGEAEKLVLQYSDVMHTFILRPPLIYGPGVKGNFLRLLNAVHRNIPLPFASIRNARSLLFVGNLTSAIETVIASHKMEGIFHIADEEALSTPNLVCLIAVAMNKKNRLFPCPPQLLEKIGSTLRMNETTKKLTRSLMVSNEKSQKQLNWIPRYSLENGITKLVRSKKGLL